MRLFSRKEAEEEEELGGDLEEEEALFGEEEAEEEEEEGLDPELQERLNEELEKARDAERSRLREKLVEMGWDLTEDGTPVVRDARKAADSVGLSPESTGLREPSTLSSPAPQPGARSAFVVGAPGATIVTETEEEAEEIPDPITEPEAFRKWSVRQVQKEVERALSAVKQEQEQLGGWVRTTAQQRALETVKEEIRTNPRYAPLQSIIDHQDFEPGFVQVMQQFDPRYWTDPTSLVRMASILYADLAPEPQGETSAASAGARAQLQRQSWEQVSPASTGRSYRGEEYRDEERQAASQLGITPAQYRLLGESEIRIDDYLAAGSKKAKR